MNMKKIYQTPATDVVKVELQNMVAASPNQIEKIESTEYTGESNFELLSRRKGFWDED